MAAHPLFVVGSPRSGTSILVRALQRAGYAGFAEGNFLSLIHPLMRDIERHFATYGTTNPQVLTSRIDAGALGDAVARQVVNAALAQYESPVWLDKTGNPEMIEIIPVLLRLLPTSRFVFARRRAIENIVSRLIKFPRHTFEYHCADWARNMAAWRKLRAAHPNVPAIEIDQHDISEQPGATAAALAHFLELAEDARATLERTFRSERPQQSEPGSAQRVLSLQSTGWSAEQIRLFEQHCGEQMRAFGYSTDANYRAASPSGVVDIALQA